MQGNLGAISQPPALPGGCRGFDGFIRGACFREGTTAPFCDPPAKPGADIGAIPEAGTLVISTTYVFLLAFLDIVILGDYIPGLLRRFGEL